MSAVFALNQIIADIYFFAARCFHDNTDKILCYGATLRFCRTKNETGSKSAGQQSAPHRGKRPNYRVRTIEQIVLYLSEKGVQRAESLCVQRDIMNTHHIRTVFGAENIKRKRCLVPF